MEKFIIFYEYFQKKPAVQFIYNKQLANALVQM